MDQTTTKNIQRIASGAVVGAANSLFGGGGGMIAVPLLNQMGLGQKRAHATAILIILPVCILSFVLYLWRGLYDFSVLIPTAIGVTAGGLLGANLLGKMPVKIVGIVFAALQLIAGLFLFLAK